MDGFDYYRLEGWIETKDASNEKQRIKNGCDTYYFYTSDGQGYRFLRDNGKIYSTHELMCRGARNHPMRLAVRVFDEESRVIPAAGITEISIGRSLL